MKYLWILFAVPAAVGLTHGYADVPLPPTELVVAHFDTEPMNGSFSDSVSSPSDRPAELHFEQASKAMTKTTRCQCSRVRCRCRSHWLVSADYLHWKTRRTGLDIAIADANTDNNIEGPLKSIDFDSDSGFRCSIGYLLGSGWDAGFQYTLFETEEEQRVTEPAGGQLWLTRANPASFNNSADAVDARADLDLDVFDLEVGYWLRESRTVKVRGFGGFRYASLDQAFSARYSGGTISPDGRLFSESTDLDAYGLRAGSEAQWLLPAGWSLSGRLASSILVGDFQTRYREFEPGFPGAGNVLVTDNFFDVVPIMDVTAGVSKQFGRLSLETGYEAAVWFSADRRHSFTGAETVNRGVMTNVPHNLGLDGFYFRLSYLR